MSNEIYTMSAKLNGRDVIHIVRMVLQDENISDFVRRIINEKGLSYRKVAEKSGGLITHTTVGDVVNKRVSNLTSQTISGLAKGLGVTESEIFALARGNSVDQDKITNEKLAVISFGFENMPKKKREKLEPLIDLLEREYQRIKDEPE